MTLPAIQLSSREKYVVGAGAAAVLIVLIYQFIVTPVIDGREAKQRQVAQLAEQLDEMRVLKAEYETLNAGKKKTIAATQKRSEGFTLFSFLEKVAGQAKIKDKISHIKPSSTTNKETGVELSLVNIKFKDLIMEELIDFLYNVETSPEGIFVRGVSITKGSKGSKTLNAVLQIETVKR